MNQVNKFYLKHAVYEIEIEGRTATLLLNYGGNSFEVVGSTSQRVSEIAKLMLKKKHNVNFAYKFNGRIDQENL